MAPGNHCLYCYHGMLCGQVCAPHLMTGDPWMKLYADIPFTGANIHNYIQASLLML